MTKSFMVSIKTKQKLFFKCRGKPKDHAYSLTYQAYKSMFNKVKRRVKTLHIHSVLHQCKNDMRKYGNLLTNNLVQHMIKKGVLIAVDK